MDKQTFFTLIDKYHNGLATDAERALVEEYYRRLEHPVYSFQDAGEELTIRESMLNNIARQTIETQIRRPFVVRYAARLSVAATVLFIITSVAVMWWPVKRSAAVQAASARRLPEADILPGKNAAILTLSDGKQILLDSAWGELARQGGAGVFNAHGMLTYHALTNDTAAHVWHIVSTARGNQYRLTLPDGSRVWLNAASRLRFPTVFAKGERTVELSGEAYFEIAKDMRSPFRVITRKMDVEVLGTQFNINAFDDENVIRTSLINGSVKVIAGEQKLLMAPGQQAQLNTAETSPIILHSRVDMQRVMAWKNGFFEFDDCDLATVLREISRWYDVEVEWKGQPSAEKFGGRVSRNLPLSDVLKLLGTNGMKFERYGKRLVVQP